MRHCFLLLILSLLLLGCGGGGSSSSGSASQADSASSSAGVTTFRVALPTTAPQQIRGQETRIDRVTVAVSSGGSVVRTAETNVATGQTTVDISVAALSPGEYTIKVDGFQGTTLLATDTASATLTADRSVTVTLTLTFVVPLTIDPVAFNLIPTATQQLTASRGGTVVTAVWASSDTGIATVDANTGLVTGVNVGTANITATENGDTVTSVATVSNLVVLNSIDITPVIQTIEDTDTQQYQAFGNFSDGSRPDITSTVTWDSSAPGTATIVAGGLASAVEDGTTTITAMQGGVFSNAATLNVGTVTLDFIEVEPMNATIAPGDTQQFTAIANFSDGSMEDFTNMVTWDSDTPGVALIDSDGLATGVADGTTNISADDGMTGDSQTLTVESPTGPGTIFATATDASLIDDYVLPDVAVVGTRIMLVKANSSMTFESHVLMERLTAAANFSSLSANGPMVDFGGSGSFVIGSGTLPSRGDRSPSVTMNRATASDVAVAYRSGSALHGRVFSYASNPAGTGSVLAAISSPRNASISMNTPLAPSVRSVVSTSYAQGFIDYVVNFSLSLGSPALGSTLAATTSTSIANDVAVSDVSELSVRAWIDTDVAPGVVRYQLFNQDVPATAVLTVMGGATPFTGTFEEVSVSMFENGNFVIVVGEEVDPVTFSLRAAAFNSAGTQLGGILFLSTPLNDVNRLPDVEVVEGATPGFYVTWVSGIAPTDPVGQVRLSRFDFPAGTPNTNSASGGFVMNDATNPPGLVPLTAIGANPNNPPAVDVNAAGAGVVVWVSKPGTADSLVFARPFPINVDLNF